MLKIVQAKRVIRQAAKVGRVQVKPVDYFYVEALENECTKYGLNVHASGKVEFFINSMYAMPEGLAYNAMLKIAKGV